MDSTLGHLRVIEVGGGVASICAHYLADLGADVIKIEPPGGDPMRLTGPFAGDIADRERSLAFLHFNLNKRSVVLDLTDPQDCRVLKELAATADVLVESLAPGQFAALGLGYQQLREVNPGLVMVSLAPFGQTGPFSRFKGNNAIAEAMSGFLYTMGDRDHAPIISPTEMLSQVAGMHGAYYALAALHDRRASGVGQHADLSLQEVGVQMRSGLSEYALRQMFRRRPRMGYVVETTCVYEALDGFVFIQPVQPRMWQAWTEWLDNPVLQQPEWVPLDYRMRHQDAVEMMTKDFPRQFAVADFVREGQGRRIPTSPVNPPEAFVESEQARILDTFIEVDHPVVGRYRTARSPFRLSASPPQFLRPAPLLGEHQAEVLRELHREGVTIRPEHPDAPQRRHALAGLRILDFTHVLAGPVATQMLAFLGAEVIKVEAVGAGSREPGPVFADLNRGKKSIAVNTWSPEGRELVLKLAATCDVVIDNFSARVMERMGLDYAALRQVKPDIIAISMPGLGRTGPLADWVAFGPTIQAYSGLFWMWRQPGLPVPAGMKNPPVDFLGAAQAALATLAAIEYRDHTGKGQFIDLVMLEGAAHLLGPVYLDYLINNRKQEPRGYASDRYAPFGCYPCLGDDAWCVIACESETEWTALGRVMGGPVWMQEERFATREGRIRHRAALDELIAEWTRQFTPRQVMLMLQKAGIPAGMVQNAEDLYYDLHLRARGHIVPVAQPAPWGTFEQAGVTAILSETPGDPTRPVPLLGQHTNEVLCGLLGMPAETVRQLREKQVLG